MTTILEIQKLDAQKRKILASVTKSNETKLLEKLTAVMKEGRTFVSNISNASSEMIDEYNEINRKYNNLKAKAEITQKQKVENSDLESLASIVESTNSLASEGAIMEQRMRELMDKSTKLLNDYNTAMNKLKTTKQKVDALKEMIAKMQESVLPQVKELEQKIEALSQTVDKEVYAKYTKMRDDNIFPVYVRLNGNMCGGCQMELPLSFVEKLKLKGSLPCEECHRIILFEEKK